MRSSAFSLRLAGAAFLFFASAVPAIANDTGSPAVDNASSGSAGPAAAAPAPVAAKPKKEPKICHTQQATGSKLGGKRICLTARQWRDLQD